LVAEMISATVIASEAETEATDADSEMTDILGWAGLKLGKSVNCFWELLAKVLGKAESLEKYIKLRLGIFWLAHPSFPSAIRFQFFLLHAATDLTGVIL